jgi:hypothetical protein
MDITRRGVLKTAPSIAGIAATGWMLQGFSCSATAADDLTLVIGAAEGVLDIILPFIPGGSPLVGVANSIANALAQVVTEWGSADATSVKWEKMLTILEAIPGEILTLSPQLQAIIAGVGAAVQTIIGVIVQLQSGAAVGAPPAVRAISLTAPNPKGTAALLSLIKATQARLPKL